MRRGSAIRRSRLSARHVLGVVRCGGVALWVAACLLDPSPARAYRPFTGSDATTGDVGQFSLELGPLQYLHSPEGDALTAPAVALTLAVLPRTEVIVDFVGVVPLRPAASAGYRVRWTDVLLKLLLRNGALQDEPGVSAALEAAVLTPEINGDRGFGASANLIFSDRWDWFVAHLNNAAQLSRGQLAFVSANALLAEFRWSNAAWPVAELRWDHDFDSGGNLYSALAGAILGPERGAQARRRRPLRQRRRRALVRSPTRTDVGVRDLGAIDSRLIGRRRSAVTPSRSTRSAARPGLRVAQR